MQQHKKFDLRTCVLIGVLAALVFALSLIQINIPIGPGNNSRLHLGNIMCLLAGVLFGPVVGGLSAGIGSMLFDFTSPLYISEFWITFLMKFAMGFLAGAVAWHPLARRPMLARALVAGVVGQGAYILLYLFKSLLMSHFVYGNPWAAAAVAVAGNAVVSGFNGLLSVIACTLLAPVLHTALNAAGFYSRPAHPAG